NAPLPDAAGFSVVPSIPPHSQSCRAPFTFRFIGPPSPRHVLGFGGVGPPQTNPSKPLRGAPDPRSGGALRRRPRGAGAPRGPSGLRNPRTTPRRLRRRPGDPGTPAPDRNIPARL